MSKVFEFPFRVGADLSFYEMAIIVPVFNRKKITVSYLNQLKEQSFHNFVLILIDNGNDGTYEEALKVLDHIIILKGKSDLWWGNSLQYGINFLKASSVKKDLIVHINNDDTLFENDFLSNGNKLLELHGGIVCAQAVSNKDPNQINKGVNIVWGYLNFNPWTPSRELNCVSTRGIFMHFSDILKIGEFRDKILPHYLSDYEFTVRAHQKGLKLTCPDELRLTSMTDETGIHTLKNYGILKIWGHLLDKRNAQSPFIYIKFSLLRAPWKYKAYHLLRYSYRTVKILIKSLLISLNIYSS